MGQVAMAQKVFVVEVNLLQAGTGNAGELELRILRRFTGFAAFGDVLHPAARRLNLLVPSAAARGNIAVATPHRHVKTQPRHRE